ncbi:MAG: hypothetical protein HYW89_03735 [Candidatus Sungiibacteriota bacterium]|uniref:Uncharacterized protein n=1 Tax=Candidatus Sungiibacteriota bacterium TaxID=2750080 RepID=A0A7T5RJ68_9BACT|nr:MAG: hypothetical protein HYW89_03735 [Candidatus Sungbacteria bacterium]
MQYEVKLIRAEDVTPDGLAEKTGKWIKVLAKTCGEPVSMTAVSPIEGRLGQMLTLHTMVLFKSE